MSKSKHYPKAPIIEAVLDLQVLPCKDFDKSFYDSIKKELSRNFKAKSIDEMTVEFNFASKQRKGSHSKKRVGIRLESIDGKYVIQAKENGYSFSILNFYDRWDDFSKEAYKYWNVYKKIFHPQKVTRQALRYINRIDIPQKSFELKDYFRVYPRVFEDELKVDIGGFFLQSQIIQKEGGFVNLTQTVTQPVKPGHTSVVLDIDAFDTKTFSPNSKELKSRIELLRDQKNFIFRSAITPKTEELIS